MIFLFEKHTMLMECLGDWAVMKCGEMETCSGHGHKIGNMGFFCFECILHKRVVK